MATPVDLDMEMLAASAALPFRAAGMLAELGVPREVIARGCAAGLLGLVRAECGDSGFWEPCGGVPHLVVGVHDHEGALVDMVAFRSADPGKWALRVGGAWLLGGYQFHRIGILDGAGVLPIFGTPLGWLKARCAGICVLEWSGEAVGALRALGPDVTLAAEDDGAAAALLDMLRWRDLPAVEVAGRGGRQLRQRVAEGQAEEERERAERRAEDLRRIREAMGDEEWADWVEAA